jgi:hypothetical protein
LQWIVNDMPREVGPIETSFLTMVAIAASAGVPKAERVAAYWEQCRTDEEAARRAKEERRAARRKRPARAKAPGPGGLTPRPAPSTNPRSAAKPGGGFLVRAVVG